LQSFEYESNFPAQRTDHIRDVTDLFDDLKNGTLPAVSFVKPDGAMDGHPNSSKLNLFEAFTKNIIDLAQSNPEQWASTAILITVDEGGATTTAVLFKHWTSSEMDRASR